jgi:arginyl-tRNA synthetase
METADLFHKFYEKCRVITADKELTNTRLAFVKCIASGIKDGLSLLGVSAPDRM